MKSGSAWPVIKRCIALAVALCWLPAAARAGWTGFLRLDGVAGESPETNHVGWMEVSTANVANLTNSNPAHLPGLPPGPTEKTLCFVKNVDKASPMLKLDCAQGTLIPSGALDLTSTNSGLAQFLRLNLTNVLISSVSSSGNANGEARPMEEICFLAQIASWNYARFDSSNGLPREYVGSFWDFQNNIGGGSTNNPVFATTGIRRTDGVELNWPAIPGKRYRIYAVNTLGGAFIPIAELTAPAAGGGVMTNIQPATSPAMFFVVEELP